MVVSKWVDSNVVAWRKASLELERYGNHKRARVLIGGVDYDLRISGRARNVTLKVNRANGLVVVVPRDFDHNLLPGILNSRQAWIDRQLQRFEALPGRFEHDWPPSSLPLPGADRVFTLNYGVAASGRLSLVQEGDVLNLVLPSTGYENEKLAALLIKWLKSLAQEYCEALVAELSAVTGLTYNRVAVRGQKTRWGSYSSKGTLSLNYKLLFLPGPLLRHVILHELSHSVHMNHSPDFWKLLESFDPDSKRHDRALSDAGRFLPAWLE